MAKALPTKDGDVVITFKKSHPSPHFVWTVHEDGQQEPNPLVSVTRFKGRAAAEQRARAFAAESHGTVFLLEQDSGEWTKLREERPTSRDDRRR